MPRMLFEKTGNAIWISHLDLMRVFQRAFKRAGLPLKHTQGFNPRPSVSIALPLSVGIESRCELLDFDLDGVTATNDEIREKLNAALISGVKVLSVYDNGSKIKNLATLDCSVYLEYDSGIPAGAAGEIQALFSRESVIVEKKSKNGLVSQDIIPMIYNFSVCEEDANTVCIRARICCQNPALNPAQISLAICGYLPHLAPDFSLCKREDIFDREGNQFR